MVRGILKSLILLMLCSNAYADKISAPPPLLDSQASLQHYLSDIYYNIHSPEVIDTAPTSSPQEGLTKLYYSDEARIYVYINDTWKYVSIEDNKFGDGTNYTEFKSDGDLLFVGTAGLSFGSCYGNHIGWSQTSAAQNTWYNISDTDMTDGKFNNVSHDGSGKLTTTYAGKYLVSYQICFEDDTANDHIETGIEISGSGSANSACMAHSENKFANEEEHLSSTCILELSAGATVELSIRTTDNNTPDISVQAINLTITQIGG